MTPEDFLGIVTHTILDGHQRYIALCAAAPQQMPAKDSDDRSRARPDQMILWTWDLTNREGMKVFFGVAW